MIKDSGRELDVNGPEQSPVSQPFSPDKGGVHPLAATIGKVAAPTRTAPDVLRQPTQPKEKNPWSLKKKIALALSAAAITAAGVGGGILGPKLLRGDGQTGQTETIGGIILDRNSFTPVSQEEEQKLWENTKTVDLENHTLVMGFPIDQATIEQSPNLRIDQQFDAILPPYIDANQLKQAGVKNLENMSGLPQGTEYKVRYDDTKFDASVIILGTAGVTETIGASSFTPAYTSYRLILRDKESGKSAVQQTISGLYAEPLIQTEPYPTQVSPVYENGTPIKSGDAILRLTTDQKDWDGRTGQALPGERGQFTVRSYYQQENPRAPIPLTQEFLSNNAGGIVSQ